MAKNRNRPVQRRQNQHKTDMSRGKFLALLSVTALVFFVAGTRSNELLASIGSVLGIKTTSSISAEIDLSSIDETYRKLKSNYDGDLDVDSLISGANKGLVAAAGDPYTAYMTKEEMEAFDNDLQGDIGGGIGAEIGVRSDIPTIIRVLADNPAEKSGLKANDKIMAVNDESAVYWTAEEAVGKIRGEPGTTVKLTILRDDRETLDFTITRQEVTNPSVVSSIEDGVGILKISRFDGNGNETVNRARQAVVDLKQRGAKSIILDLRSNGGGHVEAAEGVASLWLDDKLIMTERRNGKVVKQYRSGSNALLAGVPTVVLVNGSSASASEIVAGALKDHGMATLIGEETFGKGTMQTILPLSRDATLKVTTARWFTPAGVNISETGIKPDQEVELTLEDFNASRDPQMSAAKRALSR